MNDLRLGVNIDHVATLRNIRRTDYPDPLRAAMLAKEAGADSITVHLREDRRHIRDDDVRRIRDTTIFLNLEMAATEEMQAFALEVEPDAVCIVPESRQELTTESGLDVVSNQSYLRDFIAPMIKKGIRVSMFIEADPFQIEASKLIGAQAVELHTGHYANANSSQQAQELAKIKYSAQIIHEAFQLECHAGHGLNYDNVAPIAALLPITELNIGHFLVGEALFVGLKETITQIRSLINQARTSG